MKVFCLTGGIGSGKSTFAALLERHDVVRIDADAVTMSLQQPGQPVFNALIAQWGNQIVTNGELDRAALGKIIFSDPDALKKAEQIIHPEVRQKIENQLDELSTVDVLVVLELPLLQSGDTYLELACGVIVVDCSLELATTRIVANRGLSLEEAQKRIASQISRQVRLEMADYTIDNSEGLMQLEAQVLPCLAWMHQQ